MRSPTCDTRRCIAVFRTSASSSMKSSSSSAAPSAARCNRSSSSDCRLEPGPQSSPSIAQSAFSNALIPFQDNLPVIQLASGQAVAFERDWLVRSLARAAQCAGYGKWWLAEHVAESVTSYLRDQREITVLPLEQLTKAVQSVLQ